MAETHTPITSPRKGRVIQVPVEGDPKLTSYIFELNMDGAGVGVKDGPIFEKAKELKLQEEETVDVLVKVEGTKHTILSLKRFVAPLPPPGSQSAHAA